MSDNGDLRQKIDEAKRRLPLPSLLERLGLGAHTKKSAHCVFHQDDHKSFSVFKGNDDFWHWTCFAGCGDGDEITFLAKLKGQSLTKAMNLYLEMAGFPAADCSKSREYPARPASPARPESPVSEGQAVDGEVSALERLAAQNACTQVNTARARRFKLLRDLKAVQKTTGRKLQISELTIAFDQWHRLSLPFLDPAKTRDNYEAKFLSEFRKVRFATGEGTLATALENVAKLSPDQVPEIPNKPNAPERWRRLAALHRELSRLCGKPVHFLAYRDAAKVVDGLTHQQAYEVTGALSTLGLIDIVNKGKAGLDTGEAAEFRYLYEPQCKPDHVFLRSFSHV
ncbi:MAG TPA: CHC2 zinc finger domain-containing protein [Candidatus Udaeobacter sp.]|jgi:hypothetical protein